MFLSSLFDRLVSCILFNVQSKLFHSYVLRNLDLLALNDRLIWSSWVSNSFGHLGWQTGTLRSCCYPNPHGETSLSRESMLKPSLILEFCALDKICYGVVQDRSSGAKTDYSSNFITRQKNTTKNRCISNIKMYKAYVYQNCNKT